MKNKILIISTRKIFEKDTIFANAKRCDNISVGLKKYFVDYINSRIRSIGTIDEKGNKITLESMPIIIKDFLNEKNSYLVDVNNCDQSESSIQTVNDLSEEQLSTIKNCLKYFPQTTIQKVGRSLKENKQKALLEIFKELQNQYNSEKDEKKRVEIAAFTKDINGILALYPKAQDDEYKKSPSNDILNIEMGYDDIGNYLQYGAINIDKEIGSATIQDRISFYKILSEVDNDVQYTIYAVWPLGTRDTQREGKDGKALPRWIDRLAQDFTKNAPPDEDFKKDEILLLLHDNDIKELKETPFKTDFANQSYSCVNRSLAVFQHSNNYFLNIINQEGGAKTIFETAMKYIVNDWYVYYLKDLSNFLASYTGSANDSDLKSKLNDIKSNIFKKDNDSDFLKKCYLLTTEKDKSKIFYDANFEINKMIRELRIL